MKRNDRRTKRTPRLQPDHGAGPRVPGPEGREGGEAAARRRAEEGAREEARGREEAREGGPREARREEEVIRFVTLSQLAKAYSD